MKRRNDITNEQFYTNKKLAEELSEYVKAQEWFTEIDLVIEPSAGTGSFSSQFSNCLAYDIDPKHDDVLKADFLLIDSNKFQNRKVLSVGNPPFGRQSSLAFKFIRKCCEFSDYVAFILPLSFEKRSSQDKIPLTHTLIYSQQLDQSSFFNEDNILDVPCVFQIYKRQPRLKRLKITKPTFINIGSKNKASFAFVRAGWNSGMVKTEKIDELAEATHYFVQTDEIGLVDFLKQTDWSKYFKNVGPKSISLEDFYEVCYLFKPKIDNILVW